MTNGQARLPVSDLEEVRYLIQGPSIPCPLCHLGSAITQSSVWLGRWRRPFTKLRFPCRKVCLLVSSQNVCDLRHSPRMCNLKFHLDLRTCLRGGSYRCFVKRCAKRFRFALMEGS